MDWVDLSMESSALQSPVLCYARLGILAMANSVWTWMALLLTVLLSLWRFRGINGFCVGFTWWGKHAQVRVMLQSSSSSSSTSSSSTHNTTRIKGSSCPNCLNVGRNLYMDDLDLLAYSKQTLNDRGICRRSRSKSSSTFDSLTLCNSISSECLDVNRRNSTCFLETEMVFTFEKSLCSLFAPKSTPSCIVGGNPFAEQQFESPTSKKWACSAASFGNGIQKNKKCGISEEPGRMHCGVKNSCKFLSSELIYEGGDICKDSGFLLKDDDKEEEGFYLLDPWIGISGCQRLISFESQFGWDKFLSFRLGLEWDCCTEKIRLNSDRFSEHFAQDNVVEAWDDPRRSLVNLFCIPEGFSSSLDISWNRGLISVCTIDNSAQLWDLQMAQCLNQVVVKHGTSVGAYMQDSHESLLSGFVTRYEKTSVFVWDLRIFGKPLGFLLGNQPSFHSPKIIDKKIHVSDGFSKRLFDLRMPGASPIEEGPTQHMNLSSSSAREDTARPIQNAYSEDFLFNDDDDDVCGGIGHGFLDSGKSCRSSLFGLCRAAGSLVPAQSANQLG